MRYRRRVRRLNTNDALWSWWTYWDFVQRRYALVGKESKKIAKNGCLPESISWIRCAHFIPPANILQRHFTVSEHRLLAVRIGYGKYKHSFPIMRFDCDRLTSQPKYNHGLCRVCCITESGTNLLWRSVLKTSCATRAFFIANLHWW